MEFDQNTKKRLRIMLICVGILFGTIFLYKGAKGLIFYWFISANRAPIISVSAMKVGYSLWQPQLTASGSLRAIRGVNVTTEVAGMIKIIYFTPGASVKKGDVLVQLNADSDIAYLYSLKANADLAAVTYSRDKAQYQVNAVSKQTLDTDAATLKSLRAQVSQQSAMVLKKTIRAPFDGRLGISAVNLGQYMNPGDMVVNLQALNPIYADFFVPQQSLSQLKVGQEITLKSDTFPEKIFKGTVTTINPAVDSSTRNIEVEATIDNPKYELVPGMFAVVTVNTGAAASYLTLPQTAVTFNSYGELVYLIKLIKTDRKGRSILAAEQAFVITGETRGDQIVILKGVKEGDSVVTSGQLKLKNDTLVAINNTITPSNNPTPITSDEH